MDDAVRRVRALCQMGRFQEAAEAASIGLAAEPDDVDLLIPASFAFRGAGDNTRALAAAERACALAPDFGVAHVIRSYALESSGRFRDAIFAAERAIEIDPLDPSAHAQRVEAIVRYLSTMGKGKQTTDGAQQALLSADEAVRLDPHSSQSHLVRAKALHALGRSADARNATERALSIEPDSVVGHQMLGIIAKSQGNRRAASEHFITAARNDRGGNSMSLLRSLKPGWSVAMAIAVFFAIRIVVVIVRGVGSAYGLAAALVLAALLMTAGWVWWRRVRGQRQRQIAPSAQAALDLDAELRRGRVSRTLRRPFTWFTPRARSSRATSRATEE